MGHQWSQVTKGTTPPLVKDAGVGKGNSQYGILRKLFMKQVKGCVGKYTKHEIGECVGRIWWFRQFKRWELQAAQEETNTSVDQEEDGNAPEDEDTMKEKRAPPPWNWVTYSRGRGLSKWMEAAEEIHGDVSLRAVSQFEKDGKKLQVLEDS